MQLKCTFVYFYYTYGFKFEKNYLIRKQTKNWSYNVISAQSSFSWASMWPVWMRSISFFNFLSVHGGWEGYITFNIITKYPFCGLIYISCACTCIALVFLGVVFLVPLFSLWLVYERWHLRWFQPPRPSRHAYVWTKAGYKHFQSTHWTVYLWHI